jgi:hypothetical protein
MGKKVAEARRTSRLRRSRLRWLVSVLALVVGIGATYLGWNAGWGRAASVGDPAPPFVLPDQNGRQVSIADYLGQRPIVLFFYMTHT